MQVIEVFLKYFRKTQYLRHNKLAKATEINLMNPNKFLFFSWSV